MACLALVRGGRRCKNWASIDQGSRQHACQRHTKYFDDKYTIKEHLYKYAPLLHRFSWTSNWLDECIECGAVDITEDDFQRIVINDRFPLRWVAFVLICSRHIEIKESWNPSLWKNTITQLWRLSKSIGPITVTWKDIQDLICVKGDVSAFYRALSYYPISIEQLSPQECIQFMEECSERDPAWFMEFLLTPTNDVYHSFKNEEYISWLHTKKEEFLKRRIQLKEELFTIAWHPDRIIDWILDLEEKKRVQEEWL